ncbi:hypothetical protein VOLCADRAFT_105880 [Volvox carteri f. nagariensis]|uniref:Uncharacterized protein n=1 Tax=Volvox carteri f. nagariensis TaxID=3068 RepID=D8U3U4_VOLCA|nr:uncharacterized protein VOLCADRAFT_105880 [Volvox carteri f. nagariensis]EFJ45589.1 hypothetical protein VOLCADRAFT_105880 [Volvox carteri f. nagariensis]|eukprot:XP_002953279.1 hypothetical protein VOLCADRAFT_105880 [Volvox carteri f. nagariensis]
MIISFLLYCSRTSELLAVEDFPVQALALDPDVGPDAAAHYSSPFSSSSRFLFSSSPSPPVVRLNTPPYPPIPAAPCILRSPPRPPPRPKRHDVGPTGGVGLWAATSASHINMWVVPRGPAHGSVGGADSGRAFSVARRSMGVHANMRNRMSLEQNRQPLARIPEATIPGIPALVAHEVLSDKRRVLTRDMGGHVGLWDVLQGTQVASYGKVDFGAKSQELWEPRSVPSWFTADTRLGCLCISLEPPSAFMAEEYGVALELGYVADDFKSPPPALSMVPHPRVNYGKLVLDCVFAKWRYKLQAAQHQIPNPAANPTSPNAPITPTSPASSPGAAAAAVALAAPSGGAAALATAPGGSSWRGRGRGGGARGCWWSAVLLGLVSKLLGMQGAAGGEACAEIASRYNQGDSKGDIIAICIISCRRAWHALQQHCSFFHPFDGSEAEPAEIPTWVADVVLRNANVTPKEAKCAFVLLPAEGSDLPPLQQSKLNAPRILQVYKVANYCSGKLQDMDLPLVVRPFYLTGGPHPPDPHHLPLESPPPKSTSTGKEGEPHVLELTCNGMAVPYEMSLASVKKFIWKKSDDLLFHYRTSALIQPPTDTNHPVLLAALVSSHFPTHPRKKSERELEIVAVAAVAIRCGSSGLWWGLMVWQVAIGGFASVLGGNGIGDPRFKGGGDDGGGRSAALYTAGCQPFEENMVLGYACPPNFPFFRSSPNPSRNVPANPPTSQHQPAKENSLGNRAGVLATLYHYDHQCISEQCPGISKPADVLSYSLYSFSSLRFSNSRASPSPLGH